MINREILQFDGLLADMADTSISLIETHRRNALFAHDAPVETPRMIQVKPFFGISLMVHLMPAIQILSPVDVMRQSPALFILPTFLWVIFLPSFYHSIMMSFVFYVTPSPFFDSLFWVEFPIGIDILEDFRLVSLVVILIYCMLTLFALPIKTSFRAFSSMEIFRRQWQRQTTLLAGKCLATHGGSLPSDLLARGSVRGQPAREPDCRLMISQP
jgi:hypothetical protein